MLNPLDMETYMPVNYGEVRQSRMEAAKRLLQAKGLNADQVDKWILAKLVKEADLPEFRPVIKPTGQILKPQPLLTACRGALLAMTKKAKYDPSPNANLALAEELREITALIEEAQKRLQRLQGSL